MKGRPNITVTRHGTGLEPIMTSRKAIAPTCSWWTEPDFAAAYAREKPRLLLHTHTNRSSDYEK